VRIASELIDEIVAHAREDAPNECCGLVAGTERAASRVFRARNEMASPLAYNVHPQDLLRITTEIEDAGEQLVAIYHSHTKSRAEPSQTDINLAANWPDPVYLICSIADAGTPVVRGWHLREGTVAAVELSVPA
jgi:[CysO sulfur-carrier protein]-S-L-cysteine hydrolase